MSAVRVRALAGLAALGMLAGLAGCGSTMALHRADGRASPAVPYGATAAPDTAALLEPGEQARPQRTGDVLIRSQERKPDPFDLPPH